MITCFLMLYPERSSVCRGHNPTALRWTVLGLVFPLNEKKCEFAKLCPADSQLDKVNSAQKTSGGFWLLFQFQINSLL